MRCDKCGSVLPEGALFCEDCGARQRVQTRSRYTAGSGGVKGKSANKKRSKRARRARRIRGALYICGAVIAAVTLILGINFFREAKTSRAISSADDLVASALVEYVDSTGTVSVENSEAALSAVYQSALEAVSRGTFISAEQNDNCVAIGLPGGGYYVYLASDGETDEAAFAPGGFTSLKAMQIPENSQLRQPVLALSLWSDTAASSDAKSKIVTIQPYCAETQRTHPLQCDYPDLAAETIAASLDTYSFLDNGTASDDNRDDAEVNVDFLKSLSQYAVVIWHGHGGYSSEVGSFLGITDSFNNRYISDLRNGRIIRLYGGGMGVTSAFFDKYLQKNTSEKSLIYLGACLSGKDGDLADAFLDKGFDCVVANSETISRTYNLDMLKSFFEGMSAGTGDYLTTSEAIENAKLICGDYDPYSTYHAVPILQGDTALRFATGEQVQTPVAPVATDDPTEAPVDAWAKAYADVLGMEKVGTGKYQFVPMVFLLLDMNGDGVPELIAAEIVDGDKASEIVFESGQNGACISNYAIYSYQNNEVVCLVSQWNSYSNCIFKVSNEMNIVSGNSGTAYEGFIILNYDGNKLTAFELATDWGTAEFEGLEEPYYLYGECPNLQDIGSGDLEYISESEYDLKYNDTFNNITEPVFYDNTAQMRSQILGVSMPVEQPSGGETPNGEPNITEQLCQLMVQNYSGYLGKSYEEICSILGDPQTCQFEGEGESYFVFIVEGEEVKYYFDQGIQWEELFTYEELSQSSYSCSGSVASSFYPADATCEQVMITGSQTGLLTSPIILDEQITGPKERIYPEGQDEFYYRYYFMYDYYRISIDLMNDYSFGHNNWMGIQLNDDY